jgi:hypothetical protein
LNNFDWIISGFNVHNRWAVAVLILEYGAFFDLLSLIMRLQCLHSFFKCSFILVFLDRRYINWQ